MRGFSATLIFLVLLSIGCSSTNQQDIIVVKSSGYGYSADNPVYCGGGINGERKYLSKLRGPQGQWVKLTRLSDCCHFEIPGNHPRKTGHLSRWTVRYAGMTQPFIIYLNAFQKEPVHAPSGFALAN